MADDLLSIGMVLFAVGAALGFLVGRIEGWRRGWKAARTCYVSVHPRLADHAGTQLAEVAAALPDGEG